MGAVRRRGGYCSQQISRSGQPPGDVAANHSGDALVVWRAPGEQGGLVTTLGLADDRRPAVKRLAVSRRGLGRGEPPARIRFALSEAARLRLTLGRLESQRFRPFDSLVRSFPAGPNVVSLDALVGRGGLSRGSYQVLGTARDCGGRNSRTETTTFVVGR